MDRLIQIKPELNRVIVPAVPAAGSDWSHTMMGWQTLELVGVRFTLITGVAVPLRQVAILIWDNGTVVAGAVCSGTQAASLTYEYYGCLGVTQNLTAVNTQYFIAIPAKQILTTTWVISSLTVNLAAADQFTGIEFYGRFRSVTVL